MLSVIVELIFIILDPDPYLSVLNQTLNAATAVSDFITVQTPTTGIIISIIIAMAALLCSAIISGSESAYLALRENDIDDISNENAKERIRTIVSNPQKLLAAILMAGNFMNAIMIIFANYALCRIFIAENAVIGFLLNLVIVILLLTAIGVILPKLLAKSHPAGWAVATSKGISLLCRAFSPFSRLIAISIETVDKIISDKSDDLSLDKISQALETSNKNEDEEKEKTMLKEVLKFGGKTVSEVMTPRVDITDIEWNSPFSELIEKITESGYSRMPVYLENKDNMKGIIYAKDLLPYIGNKDDSFKWQSLVRKPLFVPESRMIDDILEDFRKKKIHMAIVVDEYGGTQGIVTLEDVLEEIVGEINDEYDEDENSYSQLSPDTYIFKGKTPLNDFYRATGLDESDFKEVEEDAETVAGLILNIKHDFPQDTETIEFGRCQFIVMNIDKFRINTVKVKVLPKDGGKAE